MLTFCFTGCVEERVLFHSDKSFWDNIHGLCCQSWSLETVCPQQPLSLRKFIFYTFPNILLSLKMMWCWLFFLAERLNWSDLVSLTLSAQPGVWSHAIICWIHRSLTTCQTPTDQRDGSQRLLWLIQYRLTDYPRLKNYFRCCLGTQENKTNMSSCVRKCPILLGRLMHYIVTYSMLDIIMCKIDNKRCFLSMENVVFNEKEFAAVHLLSCKPVSQV